MTIRVEREHDGVNIVVPYFSNVLGTYRDEKKYLTVTEALSLASEILKVVAAIDGPPPVREEIVAEVLGMDVRVDPTLAPDEFRLQTDAHEVRWPGGRASLEVLERTRKVHDDSSYDVPPVTLDEALTELDRGLGIEGFDANGSPAADHALSIGEIAPKPRMKCKCGYDPCRPQEHAGWSPE